jgi:hypothetical protein
MRWAGHEDLIGVSRFVYTVLVVKSEGKRPLGRPKRKWENNTRIDLQEVVCGLWSGSNLLRIGRGLGYWRMQ